MLLNSGIGEDSGEYDGQPRQQANRSGNISAPSSHLRHKWSSLSYFEYVMQRPSFLEEALKLGRWKEEKKEKKGKEKTNSKVNALSDDECTIIRPESPG